MKKIGIAIVLVFIFVFSGCAPEAGLDNNQAEIKPSTLFQGDAKRLEPHMDMVTGCVEVKYKGDKKSIGAKYELWENGEIKETNNITSRFIENGEFDGLISISLKEDIGNENRLKMKTCISDESGFVGSTVFIENFYKDLAYGPEELHEDVAIEDSQELSIWGLTAYQGSFATSGVSIEEKVKNADKGIILKIYFR